MGLFALKTNPCEDLFWFKCLCQGNGCYCPGAPSMDCITAAITPISASTQCCMKSACGCRKDGAFLGCIPHPLNDLWCKSKCCCHHSYCGVPFIGPDAAKIWFQLCCIKITAPVAFEMVPFGQWQNKFCWFRCCCQGQGCDCPDISPGIPCIKNLMMPMSLGVQCCVESECGLNQGECCECFPHPINENLCTNKMCCTYSYCGLATCLAEPFQFCCLELFEGMSGMGNSAQAKSLARPTSILRTLASSDRRRKTPR